MGTGAAYRLRHTLVIRIRNLFGVLRKIVHRQSGLKNTIPRRACTKLIHHPVGGAFLTGKRCLRKRSAISWLTSSRSTALVTKIGKMHCDQQIAIDLDHFTIQTVDTDFLAESRISHGSMTRNSSPALRENQSVRWIGRPRKSAVASRAWLLEDHVLEVFRHDHKLPLSPLACQ